MSRVERSDNMMDVARLGNNESARRRSGSGMIGLEPEKLFAVLFSLCRVSVPLARTEESESFSGGGVHVDVQKVPIAHGRDVNDAHHVLALLELRGDGFEEIL